MSDHMHTSQTCRICLLDKISIVFCILFYSTTHFICDALTWTLQLLKTSISVIYFLPPCEFTDQLSSTARSFDIYAAAVDMAATFLHHESTPWKIQVSFRNLLASHFSATNGCNFSATGRIHWLCGFVVLLCHANHSHTWGRAAVSDREYCFSTSKSVEFRLFGSDRFAFPCMKRWFIALWRLTVGLQMLQSMIPSHLSITELFSMTSMVLCWFLFWIHK